MKDAHRKSQHHAKGHPHERRSRTRKLLAVAALLLAVGWIAWNALLVESDVAQVADDTEEEQATTP